MMINIRYAIFVIFFIKAAKGKSLPDWLIRKIDQPVEILTNDVDGTITITNGLISRVFKLWPGFVTIDLYSHEKNSSVLRAVGPEVISHYYKIKLHLIYV